MKWPWNRSKRQLDTAREKLREAKRRNEELKPLARKLDKHEHTDAFAARFRAAGLGGD
jgi:hypothetical protein